MKFGYPGKNNGNDLSENNTTIIITNYSDINLIDIQTSLAQKLKYHDHNTLLLNRKIIESSSLDQLNMLA